MPRLSLAPLAALVVALVASASPAAQTCTTTWTAEEINGTPVWTSGSWTDADRWSGNTVPTTSDVACIFGEGTRGFTVTLSAPREVGGLVVGSQTASIALQLDAELTVAGNGRLFGSDRIDGDLTLGGTFELDNGNLVRGGGTVTVLSGGEIVVARGVSGSNTDASQIGDRSGSGSPSTLALLGRVEARESLVIQSALEAAGGTVTVRTDDRSTQPTTTDVRFDNGGSIAGLTVDVDAETRLLLGGTFAVSGAIGGTSDGVAAFGGNFSGVSGLAVASGGVTFEVGGALGLVIGENDTMEITGGDVLNTGLLRFTRNGQVFRDVAIRTTGTVRMDRAAQINLADGSTLAVQETGTLLFTDAVGTGNRFIYGNSFNDPGEGRVAVRGRIVEDGGNAADGIYVPVDVEGGRLESVAGILAFSGGGSLRNAELVGAEDSRLILFGAWGIAGRLTGETVATPSTDGRPDNLTVVFGDFNGVTEVHAFEPVTIAVQGGGLGIGGRINSISSGTLSAEPGATVTVETALQLAVRPIVRGVTLVNEGELLLNGTVELSEGTRITNEAGAETTFWSMRFEPGDDEPEPTSLFVNEGLVLTRGNSFNSPLGLMEGRSGAEVRLATGWSNFSQGLLLSPNTPADSLAIAEGSLLSGNGYVNNPPRSFRLRGVISPGTPEAPVDTLYVYSVALADLPGSGLTIDIDAQGRADLVRANQSPVYGGTLRVRALPGFVPTPGQTFKAVDNFRPFAAEGRFSEIVTEGFPDGVTVVPDYTEGPDLSIQIGVPVSVEAESAALAEGASGAFVLTHPAYPEPYRVAVQVSGTATPFLDFSIGANGTLGSGVGFVRVAPGTTETRVPLAAIVDGDTGEGAETVTLRVLAGSGGGGVPVAGADVATVTLGDGPEAAGLAIASVAPASIPATGTTTVTLSGRGFEPGMTVALSGPASLTAEFVAVLYGGAQAQARFTTTGIPAGTYVVTATSGGETATGSVRVGDEVEGGTTDVWVSLEPLTVREQFREVVEIRYGNDGTADAFFTPLRVTVPRGWQPQFESAELELPIDFPDYEPGPLWNDLDDCAIFEPQEIDLGGPRGGAVLPVEPQPCEVAVVFIPFIPAGGQGVIRYSVVPTGTERYPYHADLGVPFNTLPFEEAPSAGGTSPIGALSSSIWEQAGGPRPVNVGAECSTVAGGLKAGEDRAGARENACYDCLLGFIGVAGNFIFDVPCLGAALSAGSALTTLAVDNYYGNVTEGTYVAGENFLVGAVSVAAECFGVISSGGTAAAALLAVNVISTGFGAAAALLSCFDCITLTAGYFDTTRSFDPNDKLGPVGFTADGYLIGLDRAGYTIRFENLETATASAVEVTITDVLDTSVYDLDRFSLGAVALPDTSFTPPPGLTEWTTYWDRRPAVNSLVRIHAELDRQSGVAAWVLSDLDPDSYRLRTSADAGFLPPEAGNGEGQGSVRFDIGVQPDLPDGTVIANEADIVFDRNEVIRTPLYTNTIDRRAPTSQAIGVEPFDADTSWVVLFEGTDAGAGIRSYQLFAQADGGPFEYAGSSALGESVVFRGNPGVDYGFFSIAEDYVGNVEGPKTEAEATTFPVSNESPSSIPDVLTLAAPYPNPTRGESVIQLGLPVSGRVRAAVYDVRGREVAVVADGELAAGWHRIPWKADVAPGVYLVRLADDAEVRTQRLTIVR